MKMHRSLSGATIAVIAGLIVAAAAYRVVAATMMPGLPNFSPVLAIAFCGALFLPGRTAWVLPLAVLALSDVALALVLGYPVMSWGAGAAWLCIVATVASGRWLSTGGLPGAPALFGGLLANSLLFYVVTNSVSWLTSPAYAKTAAGWMQALTTGLPGYPPTWMFFRNSLASDFLFAGLILAVVALAMRPARTPALA